MALRLGLDLGTTSIGWWLYELQNGEIFRVVDGGVRIFSDGRVAKTGAPLAASRRQKRAMRRMRDRYLRRRAVLKQRLADAGLMPKDPLAAKSLELLDPYQLRAAGLDGELPLTHLGRALFHINQRRGFKSNRKTDRGDNDSGLIKDATARLDQAMLTDGARTYGEFLHLRRSKATDLRNTPPVRTRKTLSLNSETDKMEERYDFYPDRRHLEDEFNRLWAAQASHHPDVLTDELRANLFEVIFFQRPLKQPEVGLCLYSGYQGVPDDDRRLPKAHPLTQRRVLYETVNNLRVTADGRARRTLSREERDTIILALDGKKPTKTIQSMAIKLKALGKTIKLKPDERFTLETANRDAIACDPVRASLSHPDRFGPHWSELDIDTQWQVIDRIRNAESEAEFDALVDWLMEVHGLDRDHAIATANAPLPDGHGTLGETATRRILDHLQADVITYAHAVEACGWHHSDHRTGEILDALPYYGAVLERHVLPGSGKRADDDVTRFGRIANPTVHIGLNQLRRVINRIIDRYGKPEEIVVELARDLKQSLDQKRETEKRIRVNTEAARRRSEQLIELGQRDNGANRALLRLFEELGPAVGPRHCPYTGQVISAKMVFDGSCDVDHILPYSRTLDDGIANRTLCIRDANREKGNMTPWEAWGHTDRWPAIEANLKNLPENKRWRFAEDAMIRFEGESDFLDRSLTDTQYLSRLARTYLDTLYTEGGHVQVVPGRLTEMLRRHWGLNSLLSDKNAGAGKAKNRTDHRHHAIDAAVVAATDRSLLNRVSRAAAEKERTGQTAEQVVKSTDAPWEGFRADIGAQLDRIIVSHRPDHGVDHQSGGTATGTVGALHEDTALGIVDDDTVAKRIAVADIGPGHLQETGRTAKLRDPFLSAQLRRVTAGKSGKEFTAAIADFFRRDRRYAGTRRVRVTETLHMSKRIAVPDGNKPQKAYKSGSNQCFELWQLPDGKVVPQVITAWEFHNLREPKRPHPAAKRLLHLHKGDMVAIERDGETLICYVQKTSIDHGAFLVPHNESNADARTKNKDDPFRWFQMGPGPLIKAKTRRVHVDEIGRIRDFKLPGSGK